MQKLGFNAQEESDKLRTQAFEFATKAMNAFDPVKKLERDTLEQRLQWEYFSKRMFNRLDPAMKQTYALMGEIGRLGVSVATYTALQGYLPGGEITNLLTSSEKFLREDFTENWKLADVPVTPEDTLASTTDNPTHAIHKLTGNMMNALGNIQDGYRHSDKPKLQVEHAIGAYKQLIRHPNFIKHVSEEDKLFLRNQFTLIKGTMDAEDPAVADLIEREVDLLETASWWTEIFSTKEEPTE